MTLIKICAGFAAALQVSVAWSAGAATSQHGVQHGQVAQTATASKLPPAASTTGSALYHSPFSGYRPFKPEEPIKDWRRANDEVRDAGGHIGLMKGEPAPHAGHGANGLKQPAAAEGKK